MTPCFQHTVKRGDTDTASDKDERFIAFLPDKITVRLLNKVDRVADWQRSERLLKGGIGNAGCNLSIAVMGRR